MSKSDTKEPEVRCGCCLNRGIMRFLSVCPNWGRVFVSDLDTAQHILASLAEHGASAPG